MTPQEPSSAGPERAVITLARSLIDAMRSRRREALALALQERNAKAVAGGGYGGSRNQLSRKAAAQDELTARATEIWQALRKACEASALPYADTLSARIKGELRNQLAVDQRSIEEQIAPSAASAAFGNDALPMDLTHAAEQALAQTEPEIDLFLMALKHGVASGYAYSADPRATAMAIPQKTAGYPLVFISYSHDSDDHKAWVRQLAANMVVKGIDVVLDQWHLKHGRDLALFMERGIVTADYVVMICTENYVTKANERAGGVGYESLFLTGELLRKVDSEKLIPVVRQSCQPRQRPAFVTSRLFADLSEGASYADEFEELLRTLHSAPRFQPPPRGPNPFASGAEGRLAEPTVATAGTTPRVELPALPAEIFHLGKRTLATGDMAAWNQLIEKALTTSRQALFGWRATTGHKLPGNPSAGQAWTFELISTHASVIALAVAASLSGTDRALDQAPLIDRVINPEDWQASGPTDLVEAPQSIGWAIHLLSGAALTFIGRLDAALALARSPVHLSRKPQMIVESQSLTGWPPGLRSAEAWRLLTGLRNNWPWLDSVFGDKHSYRTMLTTYLLALSLSEFVERLRRGELFSNSDEEHPGLWVPLSFIGEEVGIQQRAYQAIVSQRAALGALLSAHPEVGTNAVRQWTHWLALCARAGKSEHPSGGTNHLARYADLVRIALAP